MKLIKLIPTALFCALLSISFAQETEQTYIKYYFVELIPNSKKTDFTAEELQTIQQAHMQNIGKMVEDGKLLLAGPFMDGGGLFILNVPTEDDAINLVEKDPAVIAKRFDYRIKAWVTEKGLLTLETKTKSKNDD